MPKFPATRRLWGFLWLVPDGWADIGKAPKKIKPFMDGFAIRPFHAFCNTDLRLGRESDGTLFRYCPRCLVKLTETQ
jgi:hypothetical protein